MCSDDEPPQQPAGGHGAAARERGQGRRGVQPRRPRHRAGRRQPRARLLQQVAHWGSTYTQYNAISATALKYFPNRLQLKSRPSI